MRSGIFAWLANGKLTIGLDEPREGARGFYDQIVQRPSPLTHAVDWYLRVLPRAGRAGGLGFPMAARAAPPWPKPCGGSGRWTGRGGWPFSPARAGPTNAGPSNPTPSWCALLGGATARTCGSPFSAARRIAPWARSSPGPMPARCLDLTGRLSLPEMVEWIRLSELMVTNDTGPMHVAAALGKPVVALFGPTEPRRTGPYRQLEHVLQLHLPCVPCLSSRCAYVEAVGMSPRPAPVRCRSGRHGPAQSHSEPRDLALCSLPLPATTLDLMHEAY